MKKISAQSELTGYVTNLHKLERQKEKEHLAIQKKLNKLIQEIQNGNAQTVSQVYTQVVGVILCQVLGPQGMDLGILGDKLQINACLQDVYSKMQDDVNTIASQSSTSSQSSNTSQSNTAPKCAKDLISQLKFLQQQFGTQHDWLNDPTRIALQSSITGIQTLLGLSDDQGDANTVVEKIQHWAKHPTPTPPSASSSSSSSSKTTGDQQMQTLYQYFNQGNNELSTISNSTQAQVQSVSATFNQNQHITEKGFMSTVSLENMMQQNSKAG